MIIFWLNLQCKLTYDIFDRDQHFALFSKDLDEKLGNERSQF